MAMAPETDKAGSARFAVGCAAAVLALAVAGGCSSSPPQPPSSQSQQPQQSRTGSESPSASQASITLTSPAFRNDGAIPAAYTCDAAGAAVSPPLRWSGVPAGTGWLALYAYDNTGSVIHWIVVNIKPSTTGVPAGGATGGLEVTGYLPMCPGAGHTDQYQFTIFAEPAGYHPPKIGASYAVDPGSLAAHALGIGTLLGSYSQ